MTSTKADRKKSIPEEVSNSGVRLRVLVVDDSPVNAEVARLILTSRGHQVEVVENGEEALVRWRANVYDIILMDVEMPASDGISISRRIRSEEAARGSRVPIVALTAHTRSRIGNEWRQCGMDGLLAKPVSREELLGTVEALGVLYAGGATPETLRNNTGDSLKNVRTSLDARSGSSPSANGADATPSEDPGATLICNDTVRQMVGERTEVHARVFKMCADAIKTHLPGLRKALLTGTRASAQTSAHALRGTLGILGVAEFKRLSTSLEYESMSDEAWRHCCARTCQLLGQLEWELRRR